MLSQNLDAIKDYLNSHWGKRFIKASLASHSSPVLFAKKPEKRMRFCIDYQRLNAITKKDSYPMSLIKETLALLEGAK